MLAYNGINRHNTGIHRPISRTLLAEILRTTRTIDRRDAVAYRDWLVYLGTFPLKPIGKDWAHREANKVHAFLAHYNEEGR